MKPLIIGDAVIPEIRAFDDVRDAIDFNRQIVLGAFIANIVAEKIPDDAVIYNMEPLYEGCNPLNLALGYLELLKSHIVLDYQRKNVEYLKSLGVEAHHMPFGYHPNMERCKPADKDIDVLFFGCMHKRRLPIIKKLKTAGLNVVAVSGVYGAERDALVSMAKLHINMHYCDNHPLEVVRLNYLMANKAFVVSEKGWDEEENAIYEDGVAFASYEDLVDVCMHYLSDGVERRRDEIAERGHSIISARPQSVFLNEAQEWISSRKH